MSERKYPSYPAKVWVKMLMNEVSDSGEFKRRAIACVHDCFMIFLTRVKMSESIKLTNGDPELMGRALAEALVKFNAVVHGFVQVNGSKMSPIEPNFLVDYFIVTFVEEGHVLTPVEEAYFKRVFTAAKIDVVRAMQMLRNVSAATDREWYATRG